MSQLPASDTVLAAIQNLWTGSTLTSTAGPLFTAEVPESLNGAPVVPPYTSVRQEKTYFEYTFEITYFEFSRVCFYSYALSAQDAEASARAIQSYFDWCALPFQHQSSTTVWVRPGDYEVQSTSVRYQDDSIVYLAELSYDICVQRN